MLFVNMVLFSNQCCVVNSQFLWLLNDLRVLQVLIFALVIQGARQPYLSSGAFQRQSDAFASHSLLETVFQL